MQSAFSTMVHLDAVRAEAKQGLGSFVLTIRPGGNGVVDQLTLFVPEPEVLLPIADAILGVQTDRPFTPANSLEEANERLERQYRTIRDYQTRFREFSEADGNQESPEVDQDRDGPDN